LILVKYFEESSNITLANIDTVTLNRLSEFILVKSVRLVQVHHFECALQTNQSFIATSKQFISELFDQQLLVFGHLLGALNEDVGWVITLFRSWSIIPEVNLVPNVFLVLLNDFTLPRWAIVHGGCSSVSSRGRESLTVEVCVLHQRILTAGHSRALHWLLVLKVVIDDRCFGGGLSWRLGHVALLVASVGRLPVACDIPDIVDDEDKSLVVLDHK